MNEARLLSPDRLIARRTGEVIVLVDIETGNVFELNRTAARLWEHLRDGRKVGEATTALAEEFGVDAGVVGADLGAFLQMLQEHGLLES